MSNSTVVKEGAIPGQTCEMRVGLLGDDCPCVHVASRVIVVVGSQRNVCERHYEEWTTFVQGFK